MTLPTYTPVEYNKDSQDKLKVGRYLIVRKDGKVHFERYNGTGFAYNSNSITHYYLPMV